MHLNTTSWGRVYTACYITYHTQQTIELSVFNFTSAKFRPSFRVKFRQSYSDLYLNNKSQFRMQIVHHRLAFVVEQNQMNYTDDVDIYIIVERECILSSFCVVRPLVWYCISNVLRHVI